MMQTCACCGATIVTPELLPWEKVVGQYHVKRAIEVACTGGHTPCLHAPNGLDVEAVSLHQWALAHGAGAVVMVFPCPCGNYGTPDRECTCSVELIAAYRTGDPAWLAAPNCDMHIDMVKPKYQDVVAVATGKVQESGEKVANRINYGKRFSNENVINPALDDTCYMLLGSATRLLELSSQQIQRVLAVTMTITALAGETKIHCAHLAEALQYRMRQRV
jgi:predicted ATPase with chaperone activity